jgi:hypothetical protein
MNDSCDPTIPPLVRPDPSWYIPTSKECMTWWDRYGMLDNVRDHSLAVTHVAMTITRLALAHSPRDFTADPTATIRAGALLHDLAKTYCIRHGGNHAQVGASWVVGLTGNPAIGHAVLHHVFWPGKTDVRNHFIPLVVAYSDKRVRHDTIVSLENRLEDLMHRYGTNEYRRSKIRTAYDQVLTIERQLEQLTGVPLHAYSFDSRRLVR